MKKVRLSLIACILLCLSIIVIRSIETPKRMLTWDVFGYYLYLPANFIYDDPKLTNQQWIDEIMEKYQPSPTLYQLVYLENGAKLIKYSAGNAVLYSPFFFLAHWLAPILGYPADGFSLPYQVIISIGGILWALLGVFLLRKLLLFYFSDSITAIVLVLVIAGTNYLHLVSIDGTLLTHNYLFTLYTLLIILTIRYHRNPSSSTALLLGITAGFISLIRPSEAVCFLIPLLWQTGTRQTLVNKISIIKGNPFHPIIMIAAALVIGLIQFFYWKSLTGEWIYYSYSNNPGEGFRFFPPFIIEFLFSFRKGWFVYTPIMLGSVVGMIWMFKKHKENLPAILIFFIIDIWIISSWTAWWYGGGSFSSRSLVPAYVILAIPMGYLVKGIGKFKLKWAFLIIGLGFVILNLFQSWQWVNGIIDKERMTKEYYIAVFGRTAIDRNKLDKLLLVDRSTGTDQLPEHLERYTGKMVYQYNQLMVDDTTQALRLDSKNQFSPGPDIPFKDLTKSDHVWIKSSIEVWLPEGYSGKMPHLVSSFHYKNAAYKYRGATIDEDKAVRGEWQTITYWYLSPEVRTLDDNLKVYLWHNDSTCIYIRNLKVEVFELSAK